MYFSKLPNSLLSVLIYLPYLKVWREGVTFKLVVLNGQVSTSTSVNAGVLQRSILGLLLFLIYINDLTDNLSSNFKLFGYDTCLIHDTKVSAGELNKNLKKTSDWDFQWKMIFNLDARKQAQKMLDASKQVIFNRKVKKNTHPPLVFINAIVCQTVSQKHLGGVT